MYDILKTDPKPHLIPGKLQGSLHTEDYTWGYSTKTKLLYKKHAECFYQLLCKRYTWKSITPYMIKFVDYARYFMDHGDFPMSRFQTEGGEHLNYDHSRHYFQHTTRHGGKTKTDPLLSLLSTMYRKLSYQIMCSSERTIGEAYGLYVKKHVAACLIQAVYRGYITRKLFAQKYKSSLHRVDKVEVIDEIQSILHPSKQSFHQMKAALCRYHICFSWCCP